ncbi:uncharacterized protein PV06_11263 [Exophiala oligosperma]|uniref:Uncharacterized protein n=1 Tax=Exophiala oligosperma TaxID=215243 RepID=A0A0D2A866_9EURO|nr:uncharacterized protein PV06_11263 [Exophiala oligosperma]KIW36496.1 hypothetical protein PV06_11263 [Exophiala oligosperma]
MASSQSETIDYQYLPGPVGDLLRPAPYSTTARIPISPSTFLIVTTGHIGLSLDDGSIITTTVETEFNAIFDCLDTALKHAGAKDGLFNAYRFTAYLTSAEYEGTMQAVFRSRWPGHAPTWTNVIVKSINVPEARAEINCEAAIFH